MSVISAGHDNDGATPGMGAAQRRQLTVLFADMAGYTPLAEKLGEEKTYLVMQRLHRELNEAVHAQNSTVQEMTGDGVMALFGAPVFSWLSRARSVHRSSGSLRRRVNGSVSADCFSEVGMLGC